MEKTSIYMHINCSCLKCGTFRKYMIRVGCLIFCNKCAKMFKTQDPVRKERELYLEWLEKYKEQMEEDVV